MQANIEVGQLNIDRAEIKELVAATASKRTTTTTTTMIETVEERAELNGFSGSAVTPALPEPEQTTQDVLARLVNKRVKDRLEKYLAKLNKLRRVELETLAVVATGQDYISSSKIADVTKLVRTNHAPGNLPNLLASGLVVYQPKFGYRPTLQVTGLDTQTVQKAVIAKIRELLE